jgi:hypothetical protein
MRMVFLPAAFLANVDNLARSMGNEEQIKQAILADRLYTLS